MQLLHCLDQMDKSEWILNSYKKNLLVVKDFKMFWS
jgi:hypothetical protein